LIICERIIADVAVPGGALAAERVWDAIRSGGLTKSRQEEQEHHSNQAYAQCEHDAASVLIVAVETVFLSQYHRLEGTRSDRYLSEPAGGPLVKLSTNFVAEQ
jgi:hypothetical protein